MSWIQNTPTTGTGYGEITLISTPYFNSGGREAELIAYNNNYQISAKTDIVQSFVGMVTAVTFDSGSVEWVKDVPYYGGVASSANCTYTIYGYLQDGTMIDITNYVDVVGSVDVPETTSIDRLNVGILTLSVTLNNDVSATYDVDIYQGGYLYQVDEPLTFSIISGGTIFWRNYNGTTAGNPKTIEYSLNNGEWISITSDTDGNTKIDVETGDIVRFRGDNVSYAYSYPDYRAYFEGTAYFDIYGNIMSLQNSTGYSEDIIIERDPLYTSGAPFRGLFAKTKVVHSFGMCLPATITVAPNTYSELFRDCKYLKNAPRVLPAIEISTHPGDYSASRYAYMFAGCTALTSSPIIEGGDLKNGGGEFAYMFSGCSSLNKINYYGSFGNPSWPYDSFVGWVSDVSPTGTFTKSDTVNPKIGTNGIPSGWTIEDISKSEYEKRKTYLTFEIISGGTWGLYNSDSAIEYRLSRINYDSGWQTISSGRTISVDNGDTIIARYTKASTNMPRFTGNAYCKLSGNLASMYDKNTFNFVDTMYNCSFYQMFSRLNVTDISGIYMPFLGEGASYGRMFQGCTALENADGNILRQTNNLPDSCYYGMFSGCTNLELIPTLPATTLSERCYDSMFYGCTALTYVIELPATTLANYCYNSMFRGCTSIYRVPPSILPATELADGCYDNMFAGCTSLRANPYFPILNASVLKPYCYYGMFDGCSSLNRIKCLATDISASSCTFNWVRGVSASGTFVKDSYMTSWTIGNSGIPTGWTIS